MTTSTNLWTTVSHACRWGKQYRFCNEPGVGAQQEQEQYDGGLADSSLRETRYLQPTITHPAAGTADKPYVQACMAG
jgi:hypothetical protein